MKTNLALQPILIPRSLFDRFVEMDMRRETCARSQSAACEGEQAEESRGRGRSSG